MQCHTGKVHMSNNNNHTMHKLNTIDECVNTSVNLPGMTVHPLYSNLSNSGYEHCHLINTHHVFYASTKLAARMQTSK